MAQDMSDLAASLGVRGGYATLGHSYGAFVVLQHAVDHPGEPRGTVVSSGMAAARWLGGVDRQLAAFEPAELRAQVTSSWAREREVRTEDEAAALLDDQLPFPLPGAARRGADGVPAPHRRARPVRPGRHPPHCRAGQRGD